jgi:hypothetical protein
MKHTVVYFLTLCTFFTVISCKKTGETEKKDASKATLITASTWKYSDAGIDANDDGAKDQNLPPGTLSSCETDNTITFKSDKTGIIDEGATKCETTNPQQVPFTWSMNAAETQLTLSAPLFTGVNGEIRIVEVTSTKLTLSKVVTTTYMGLPISARVIIFLTH